MKVDALVLTTLFLTVLMVCLQTPIAIAVVVPPPPPAELLWMDPIDTDDLALSKDGQYVAAVGPPAGDQSTELRFYGRSSGTPIWTYYAPGDFHSVAISADGSGVAAGNGSHIFFWNNAKSRTPGNTDPTWTSVNLGGPIEYRCLAISDDGNYVVACGTGPGVFYYAGAKAKSGSDIPYTWDYGFALGVNVEAVDISSDGDYVVAGTVYDAGISRARVAYWKNARTLNAWQIPAWMSTDPFADVVDVAVSDDGNYVASADVGSTVYYWANAKYRSVSETTCTWHSNHIPFNAIDMSSDGDSVIAGAVDGVYFWSGARTLTGKPEAESWKYPTPAYVWDVAINDAGDYMAASDGARYVYFFDNKGGLKWQYGPLINTPFVLSISSDGGTLAIGTGMFVSRYLVSTGFKTLPPRAVGGFLLPADKLALLSPWIAVSLAAVALTIFATKRRREL